MSAVEVVNDGQIRKILFNRPEARNAFNGELLAELDRELDRAGEDPNVRVVIVGGNGSAFSAGFDLKESVMRPKMGVADRRANTWYEVDMWMKLWNLPKPTIAQVHGHCLGGALELAVLCDMVVAARNTRLGEPEIAFSYIPWPFVAWRVGVPKARELLYTGDVIDAEEAHRIGMVNRVVADDQLEEEVMRLARKLATIPPLPLAMFKQVLNKTMLFQGFGHSVDNGAEMFSLCRLAETPDSEEFKEIVRTQGLKAAIQWHQKKLEGVR